jgi:predicted phosphoribosyltransferase
LETRDTAGLETCGTVPPTSKSAVSPISKSAGRGRIVRVGLADGLRVWKPAIQQVWKPAVRPISKSAGRGKSKRIGLRGDIPLFQMRFSILHPQSSIFHPPPSIFNLLPARVRRCFYPQLGRQIGEMVFLSRQDAGHQLGLHLREMGVNADVVAGLPRGGVVVAAEVADVLRCPLDVIIVRKIGHPWQREFAVGALAEEDVLVLDQPAAEMVPLAAAELEMVIAEEKDRLREYGLKFQHARKGNFAGGDVLLVDDGLATGATAEAAIFSARKKHARHITLAVPIASRAAFERVAAIADNVAALRVDPDFYAVGQYYKHFLQTTDEEVLALLRHQPADYRQAA